METPDADGEEGEEERFTVDETVMMVAYIVAGLLGLGIVANMNMYRVKKNK